LEEEPKSLFQAPLVLDTSHEPQKGQNAGLSKSGPIRCFHYSRSAADKKSGKRTSFLGDFPNLGKAPYRHIERKNKKGRAVIAYPALPLRLCRPPSAMPKEPKARMTLLILKLLSMSNMP